jgi:TRAP-type mannitol/chloroaromatic compound transport system permease small subunit
VTASAEGDAAAQPLAATRHEGVPKPHQIVATDARHVITDDGKHGGNRKLGQLELHTGDLRFRGRLPGLGGWASWHVAHKLDEGIRIPFADITSYEVIDDNDQLVVTTTDARYAFEVEDARGWFGVLQGTGVPQLGVEMIFPDDDGLSYGTRAADRALGLVEQAFLFLLLVIIVVTASTAALSDKIADHHIGRWWFTVVRGGTFTIALIGAVFATHQQRHLAMDLVSRRLSPRGRLVLGVVLKLFTIAIALLLFRSGLHQRETIGSSGDQIVSDQTIVTALPLAAVLIIVHTILHLVIDIDYLARGKTPPERARSGH